MKDKLRYFDQKTRKEGFTCIAGVDEAGRGCVAGPVVAAACILPVRFRMRGIKDSKLILPKKRELLFEQITSHERVVFSIGIASSKTVDMVNVYQATLLAMLEAVKGLEEKPELLLVDGLSLEQEIPCKKVVHGDRLSQSIAAASIIAKVTRDRIMDDYHERWPEYGFDRHKGYFTARHRQAFEKHGPCPIHRKSFCH